MVKHTAKILFLHSISCDQEPLNNDLLNLLYYGYLILWKIVAKVIQFNSILLTAHSKYKQVNLNIVKIIFFQLKEKKRKNY